MTYPNLLDIKGVGKKRYEKIQNYMQANQISLADIFAMSSDELKNKVGIPQSVAEAIAKTDKTSSTKPENKQEEKTNFAKEVIALTKLDEQYPKQILDLLGKSAPETLYVWGNLELLNKTAVGFCGSRNVTEKGLEVATDVAKQVAELGWVVVSGHARGVDLAAHHAALENNAGTIIVLPQGFDGFKLNADLKKIAKKENLLIVSEFAPNAGWTVWRAMQRNHTIIGLSNAMVLVESRTEGGTFNAGKAALRYKQPLFVVEFQEKGNSNKGNEYFLKEGAIRLLKSRETGRANISPLKDCVEKQENKVKPDERSTQLELFKENP